MASTSNPSKSDDTTSLRIGAESSHRFNRRLMIVAAASGLFLLVGGLAVQSQRSMHAGRRESLQSILRANVFSLESWLTERRHDAEALLAQGRIATAARQRLVAAQGGDQASQGADLDIDLSPTSRAIGWALIDLEGHVVDSSLDRLVGSTLPIGVDALESIQSRAATVCRPFPVPIALSDQGAWSMPGAPLMGAIAPVSDGGRPDGGLMLLLDPMDQWSDILSVTQTGLTGESYAFDRSGLLLSRCRFESPLRASGRLADDPRIASPLSIAIRIPANDAAEQSGGGQTQPLTWAADQATRGATGENVIGYTNYRGQQVVGAWTWLESSGLGVVTEIEVAEAYRPLRFLRSAYWISLALTVGWGAIAWGLLPAVSRRRGRRDQTAQSVRRLGRYELLDKVGQGGMGAVYRAAHEVLRREVAVKVLEGSEVTPQAVSRFEREVKYTARLRHPNTIAIYDYGRSPEGTFYYVMEYIDGITIRELVQQFGRQPPARVIHLLLQLCGSIGEAHRRGLVHRDIKPANILLMAQAGLHDMVKVLDFGLVKEIQRESSQLTQVDSITGTPMYMSPEAVRDATSVDERSDLYSIGAVGYTMLTGLPPFEGEATVDICLKQLHEDPLRPSQRVEEQLPDDLQNVLMSCLRKDPEQRPRSVQELADSLRQCNDAYGWSAAEADRWWEQAW